MESAKLFAFFSVLNFFVAESTVLTLPDDPTYMYQLIHHC